MIKLQEPPRLYQGVQKVRIVYQKT